MIVLEARGVTVRVGRGARAATLLDRIDLDVRAGELVALLGANGAGKSTLLAALAGDLRPSAGTIRLGGRDLASLSVAELAGRRAVLRQRSALTAPFTALAVVQLGQRRVDPAAARRWLATVELEAFAARTYPSLSGGEQQRVQLARILAQLADCTAGALFLDEPAAALDLRQQHLVERIARRATRAGHAVVLIAHELDFVARCADRAVVLRAGTVLADGPPATVLTSSIVSRAFDVAVELERTASGALVARAQFAAP